MKHLPEEPQATIVRERECGQTFRAIAMKHGISHKRSTKNSTKIQAGTELLSVHQEAGPLRKTTPREDRLLARHIVVNPKISVRQLIENTNSRSNHSPIENHRFVDAYMRPDMLDVWQSGVTRSENGSGRKASH